MFFKIDLDTIGYFLFMEEQEKADAATIENIRVNENPISELSRPHQRQDEEEEQKNPRIYPPPRPRQQERVIMRKLLTSLLENIKLYLYVPNRCLRCELLGLCRDSRHKYKCGKKGCLLLYSQERQNRKQARETGGKDKTD